MENPGEILALLLLLVYCFHASAPAHAFYLPGVAPRNYRVGDELQVKVNELSSTKTQLPYDYYFLDYCKPPKIMHSAENLGEVLHGYRIQNSAYQFKMRKIESCRLVCRTLLTEEGTKNFKEKIDDEYRVNMILDNLPAVVPSKIRDGSRRIPSYEHGFKVGYKDKDGRYYINNHLSFTVKYNLGQDIKDARIVGFEVIPSSIAHDEDFGESTQCNPINSLIPGSQNPQELVQGFSVDFTCNIYFVSSPIKWASRWDTHLLMNNDRTHWFSVINSLLIFLFLSLAVAIIMIRTLRKDISTDNQLDTQNAGHEGTGWKLVQNDVFRPPTNSDLFCVYVGTGVQLLAMALVTLIFALLGFLSPSNRGVLMTIMVLVWGFMGIFAGYASSRLYKMFNGTEWKKIALKTAVMFPGVVFAVFFVLNALIWGEKSSGAVPFGTMIILVILWFCVSVPLVFLGSSIGFNMPAVKDPVSTHMISRQVPEQPWQSKPALTILTGGAFPFFIIFFELFFILTSIWLKQYYYVFGLLFVVFIFLVISCAEISIVFCYLQLNREDYHWWWRVYLTTGSSALYLFGYAVYYFFAKLEITKAVSGILYFGYMLVISYAFFVLTGTVGFYASFWFVRKIYSYVKTD